MKDFAGSSITYYGLAREKLMSRYPRLISVLVILALICMTGLAMFLISDLVSFASNPDHKGVLVGLDLKGPENGIVPMTDGKEKSGNISANSSQSLENLSRQTKEQNFANLSQMNASLLSSQAAKGVVAASKSSSSSSGNSVDEKMGNSPAIKHHSSSSSSSAKSAKKSNDKNNLTNETAKITAPTNQSMNNSQGKESVFANATSIVDLPPVIDAAKSLTSNNNNRSNDSVVEPTAILASLPSVAASSIINPARDTSAREPDSIIKFKTVSPSSQKSEQGLNTDSGKNTDGATVSDNGNKAQSSKDTKKKSNSKAIGKKSVSSQKSKVTASSQTYNAEKARAKQIANKNRMAESLKKKAAQLKTKAAKN